MQPLNCRGVWKGKVWFTSLRDRGVTWVLGLGEEVNRRSRARSDSRCKGHNVYKIQSHSDRSCSRFYPGSSLLDEGVLVSGTQLIYLKSVFTELDLVLEAHRTKQAFEVFERFLTIFVQIFI